MVDAAVFFSPLGLFHSTRQTPTVGSPTSKVTKPLAPWVASFSRAVWVETKLVEAPGCTVLAGNVMKSPWSWP